MHKTHIFDQENNAKKMFLQTYLPYFFSDPYRKQTISFYRPYNIWRLRGGLSYQVVLFAGLAEYPYSILVK